MAKVLPTIGVYIPEKSESHNSAVPVPTAVPAFIGYTQQAIRNNKDLTNIPTRINSFGDYLLYFGGAPNTIFNLEADANQALGYKITTQTSSRFLLYCSIRLFFENGGSDCYIVSVGNYDGTPRKADFTSGDVDAPKEANILKGIQTLENEPEPTLLVIPDAVLLGEDNCAALQQEMLRHCQKMTSRFAILDVFLDENAPAAPDVIDRFRRNIGTEGLMWGAAYYPWLRTNITGVNHVSFKNIDTASIDTLIALLSSEINTQIKAGLEKVRGEAIIKEINSIKTVATEAAIEDLHKTLSTVSPLYKAIMGNILEKLNLLPPSAAIAGVYCMVDNQMGVFHAPANVNIHSVIEPLVNLTDKDQEGLNVPLDGKAVNAIRNFPGKGVVIWGARTLDGNSMDWRYINVRRTVIFLEQSIKYAIEPYTFEPNTASTWTKLKALISNFLNNFWISGGLAGATPADAFSVDIGLGVTMTPVDILDNILRVHVKVAVSRPAEYIVLTFQQKMQEPPPF